MKGFYTINEVRAQLGLRSVKDEMYSPAVDPPRGKLHPLRTGDGQWHNAASHDAGPDPFRARMAEYKRRNSRDRIAQEAALRG